MQFPYAVGSPYDTAIFLRSVSGLPVEQQTNGKVLAGLADVATILALAEGLGFSECAGGGSARHGGGTDLCAAEQSKDEQWHPAASTAEDGHESSEHVNPEVDAPAPGAVQVPMVQTVHNRVPMQKQDPVQTCAELLEPDPWAPLDGPVDSGKAGVQEGRIAGVLQSHRGVLSLGVILHQLLTLSVTTPSSMLVRRISLVLLVGHRAAGEGGASLVLTQRQPMVPCKCRSKPHM